MQVMTGSGSYTAPTVSGWGGDARLRRRPMEPCSAMRTRPLAVLALAGSLALAACGGGEQDAATTDSTTTTRKAAATTTTTTEAVIPTSMLTGLPLVDEWVQARPVVAVK